jgi:hypothetical protein
MSIIHGLCVTAKRDFLRGVHRPEDVYKVALYDVGATLNPRVEFYTTEGEVVGKGYERGGMRLKGYQCDVDGAAGILGWSETLIWRNATIKARGALIYNASKQNRAITVIDFGSDIISTNGNWRLPMPPFTAADAPVKLV